MATSTPWEYLIDFRALSLNQTMAFWVYRIDCSGAIDPQDAAHETNTLAVVNVVLDTEGTAHAVVAPVRDGDVIHAEAAEVTNPVMDRESSTYHLIDPVCGYDLYIGYAHLVGELVRGLANDDDHSAVSLAELVELAG